jgi:hypothetical protein
VIWLKDETYERLITEVEYPTEVAEEISLSPGPIVRTSEEHDDRWAKVKPFKRFDLCPFLTALHG